MSDPPPLVVVSGLPGVGKSRVSRLLADRLDAALVRTDVVRTDLFSDPQYTDEEVKRVYAAVRERARETLARDGRAVLDGTYRRRRFREDVAVMAADCDIDSVFVRVVCGESVVRKRIAQRTDTASDAAFEDYLTLKAEFDEFQRPHETVDNSGAWADTRERLRERFPSA